MCPKIRCDRYCRIFFWKNRTLVRKILLLQIFLAERSLDNSTKIGPFVCLYGWVWRLKGLRPQWYSKKWRVCCLIASSVHCCWTVKFRSSEYQTCWLAIANWQRCGNRRGIFFRHVDEWLTAECCVLNIPCHSSAHLHARATHKDNDGGR